MVSSFVGAGNEDWAWHSGGYGRGGEEVAEASLCSVGPPSVMDGRGWTGWWRHHGVDRDERRALDIGELHIGNGNSRLTGKCR